MGHAPAEGSVSDSTVLSHQLLSLPTHLLIAGSQFFLCPVEAAARKGAYSRCRAIRHLLLSTLIVVARPGSRDRGGWNSSAPRPAVRNTKYVVGAKTPAGEFAPVAMDRWNRRGNAWGHMIGYAPQRASGFWTAVGTGNDLVVALVHTSSLRTPDLFVRWRILALCLCVSPSY